ncbi:hypothetical protein [Vacuolonema iberomarrocanum]|uniref:hypothetical protein n=1 Tax=Vacuolonema iberomarrocanum TaxID=3454632 RepID=UPI001A08B98A|nr:hypothetical protein [filamentous cyanobacterium LEGE 07170]
MNEVNNLASEEYSVLAFYGVSSTEKSRLGFYETLVDWFDYLGYPPDKLSIHGAGHSGKPVSFSRSNSRLKKNGFQQVSAFTIFSTIPEGRIPINDYYLMACYGSNSYAFIATCSSIANLGSGLMFPLVQNLINILEFEYGIGYTREHHLGPAMYAIGIGQGLDVSGDAREEAMNITRWGMTGMDYSVYREGLIRDVYHWNFLTKDQLQKSVNNKTLAEWIQQEATRGSLKSLSEDITIWKVDEIHIPVVRSSLQATGNIFDWRAYESRLTDLS